MTNNKSALIEFTAVVTPAGMGDVKIPIPAPVGKWLDLTGFETSSYRVSCRYFRLLRWAVNGALIPGFALLDGSTLYASKDFPKSAYKMVAMATMVSATRCPPNWLLTRQEEKTRSSLGALDKVADLW